MSWYPIPEEQLVRAELLDGRVIEMRHLQLGDIFRCLAPDGKTYVDPLDHEDDADAYAIVMAYPIKATNAAEHNVECGYAVKVLVAPLKELLKRRIRVLN
jgi:hypothetical protein